MSIYSTLSRLHMPKQICILLVGAKKNNSRITFCWVQSLGPPAMFGVVVDKHVV